LELTHCKGVLDVPSGWRERPRAWRRTRRQVVARRRQRRPRACSPQAGRTAARSHSGAGGAREHRHDPEQINNPYSTSPSRAPSIGANLRRNLDRGWPSAADRDRRSRSSRRTTQGAKAIIVSRDDAKRSHRPCSSHGRWHSRSVGYDSSLQGCLQRVRQPGGHRWHPARASPTWRCDEAPSCTGEIAVLLAAQTATEPERLIAAMQTTLRTPSTRALVFDASTTATTTRRSARRRLRPCSPLTRTQGHRRPDDRWHRAARRSSRLRT